MGRYASLFGGNFGGEVLQRRPDGGILGDIATGLGLVGAISDLGKSGKTLGGTIRETARNIGNFVGI